MGIQESPTPVHWNFFLALEDDVFRLARYLELTEPNLNSYSIELVRILFAAASEVDVVAKQLCQKLNPATKAENIEHYRNEINGLCPRFAETSVSVPRYGLTLVPWENWRSESTPLWWRAYNNVKHDRHVHYAKANLKNGLNAVAALFVMLLYHYREAAQSGQLGPNPRLFRAGPPFVVDVLAWGPDKTLVYHFPSEG